MKTLNLNYLSLSIGAIAALLAPVTALATAGDIYETDGGSGTIFKFTPAGTKTTFASGLSSPAGLAFDGSGNLFESDIGSSNIYKFTSGGTKTTFASGLSTPAGMAFDVLGNLFEADAGSGNIYKFKPDGTRTTFAAGLNGPAIVAFDSAGNLFVSDQFSGSIFKFTPAGTKSTFASGLARPIGLAFDSSGNLFEADRDSGTIFKFTSGGMKTTFATGLNKPIGLAFDSLGNLYEADRNSGTIFKFTGGVKSTFASGLNMPEDVAVQPIFGQLLNISTRMEVLTGSSVLIAGFIITGSSNKTVLLRALGPTLSQFGLTGVLADPTLELHDGSGALITSNDNWKDTRQAAISATGLAPPNNLESAILHTLAPGNYTAVVRGKNNTTGLGLVDAYDIDKSAATTLTNISTRGFVDTGQNVMIGGLISGNGITEVIVRALGPTLSQFGVTNVLADPTLELHDGNGTLLASNDNWADTQQAQIQASGYAPPNALESAIIIVRPAGNSTAIVRGKNNTTGNALVEVYTLSP